MDSVVARILITLVIVIVIPLLGIQLGISFAWILPINFIVGFILGWFYISPKLFEGIR